MIYIPDLHINNSVITKELFLTKGNWYMFTIPREPNIFEELYRYHLIYLKDKKKILNSVSFRFNRKELRKSYFERYFELISKNISSKEIIVIDVSLPEDRMDEIYDLIENNLKGVIVIQYLLPSNFSVNYRDKMTVIDIAKRLDIKNKKFKKLW